MSFNEYLDLFTQLAMQLWTSLVLSSLASHSSTFIPDFMC